MLPYVRHIFHLYIKCLDIIIEPFIWITLTFRECDRKKHDLDAQLENLTEMLKDLQMKQQDLEDEKYELDNLTDKQAAILAEEEAKYRILMKDYEYAKDREAILMGDR